MTSPTKSRSDYNEMSVLDKTNHIFDILGFDAKQCKVMSNEELKITAPVVVVKIFEKIVGLHLDNHINDYAFESNADVVLRTLQTKYGLNGHITPTLLIRGDSTVLEQIMDIFYKLAAKTHNVINSDSSHILRSSFSKEEEQIKTRVLNISTRFNTTFPSSIDNSAVQSTLNTNASSNISQSPVRVEKYYHADEWLSSRDLEELHRLKIIEERKQQRAQQILNKHHPSRHNVNKECDDSSDETMDSSQWQGWKDDGKRIFVDGKQYKQRKPKEKYCYDTYSGYRVHPKLHALLIKKNNPEPENNIPSQVTIKSPVVGGKKHLDRTVYVTRGINLRCYKDMEPLDILLTIDFSFRQKNGKKFVVQRDIDLAANHTTVADHVYKYIVNLTHQQYKPHARMRIMRLNAQRRRRDQDLQNKEFSNYLEIQIAYKNESGEVFPNLLFSRQKTRQWPSLKVLDKRVRAFYSRINMQLHAIEGGDEKENEELLEPYPALSIDFLAELKKPKNCDILDAFDARYLHCPEGQSDDEDVEGGSAIVNNS